MSMSFLSISMPTQKLGTEKAMGVDRFEEVLANIDELLSGQTSVGRWPTPWVVPRIRRDSFTVDHIDAFYDTWMTRCGAAIIDPTPTQVKDTDRVLLTTTPPPSVLTHRAKREMTILCDGSAYKRDAAGQLLLPRINFDGLTGLAAPTEFHQH